MLSTKKKATSILSVIYGLANAATQQKLFSPEELEELEEGVRKQDKDGGQNGESAVWGPGRKKEDEGKDWFDYLDSLD